jgi:hypothetical protein
MDEAIPLLPLLLSAPINARHDHTSPMARRVHGFLLIPGLKPGATVITPLTGLIQTIIIYYIQHTHSLNYENVIPVGDINPTMCLHHLPEPGSSGYCRISSMKCCEVLY